MTHALCIVLMVEAAGMAQTIDEVTAQDPTYQLVWADEFDVDGRPNEENWTYEQGFKRNNELQWYQPENAWVEDGRLIIEGRRERIPNPNHQPDSDDWKRSREYAEYTSASLNTSGKHSWRYGRFLIRAKIVAEPGLWPAIWTLGEARGWPANGEIDIMEYYDGGILANACWGSDRRWRGIWDSSKTPVAELGGDSFDDDYHIWRMDWDENAINLYIDDRLLNTIELSKTINQSSDGANPFMEPHYILLNLAIGGTQGGDPSNTEFPTRYEIDWVRVYQKVDTEQPAEADTQP